MSLLGIGYGLTCGWPSPTILLLTSDDSPLPTGKTTLEEASWIVSIKAIGNLLGGATFGFIAKKFGRKWPLIFLSIILIVRFCCRSFGEM